MAAEILSVGLLVTHKMWGLGKVVHLDPQNAWVYFKDIDGTPKDAVKQLNRRVAVLTVAENQSDTALDHVPPMVRNGRVDPPHSHRITEQQAIDDFVADFPHAFDDPRYLKQERNKKWKAHRRVAEDLLSSHGRRIVAEGPLDALADTLKRLIGLGLTKHLLDRRELIAANEAFLRDQRAAQAFGAAVLRLVDESDERAFSGLVEATGSLPADFGRARVLTWPIVTILPFLAKPDGHMFLKPMQTRRIAEAFTFDLAYSARPKWDTYNRLLILSNRLLERLRPLGARDLIDVQSFMWVVAGWPFRRQA